MSLNIDSLGEGRTKIVVGSPGQDIFSLPKQEVCTLFQENGLLLFRGFGLPAEQLERFASQYSSHFIHEGGRASYAGYVEHVDAGKSAMHVHAENANSPFRPELVWFCCARAATTGGQTTFCDGVALWDSLAGSTQQLFREKKVKYKRRYSAETWKPFALPNGTVEDLKRALAQMPGVKFWLNDDGSLDTEYVVSAAHKTKYGRREAFANSVLGAFGGAYAGLTMLFEDDSEIPVEALKEIEAAAERCTGEILWADGDIAMFDNSRVMHGRRAFHGDERRRLYSALSWANF